MRRAAAAALAGLALLAGCGGGHHARPVPGSAAAPDQHYPLAQANRDCPAAAVPGHAKLGICAPAQKLGVAAPHGKSSPTIAGRIVYSDRSNNDPCVCGALLKRAGTAGLIAKANEGTGFIDRYAAPMVGSATRAGLVVGLYDFERDYTVSEAQVLVARAHSMGLYGSSHKAFPLTLDVESGAFSLTGLYRQIAYLHSWGFRVQIYTGGWYWLPHAGCTWPRGIVAWLSGYPNASAFCGLPSSLFLAHQFTDRGQDGGGSSDMTVWLGSRAGFNAFANAGPPAPIHHNAGRERAHLVSLYRRRTRLRTVLTRHTCRSVPLHATPPRYRHACGVWLGEGAAVGREIATVHRLYHVY